MEHHPSRQKAIVVTALFTAFGLLGAMRVVNWDVGLFTSAIYILLLVHTYPSIQIFGRVAPASGFRTVIEIMLVFFYAAAAFFLWEPLVFLFFVGLIFIAAVFNYAYAFSGEHRRLFRRKILVDMAGVLGCFLVSFGIASGHAFVSGLIGASVFLLFTIYLLFVKPLYVADHEPQH